MSKTCTPFILEDSFEKLSSFKMFHRACDAQSHMKEHSITMVTEKDHGSLEPLLDLRSYAGASPMLPPPPDIAVDASQHSPKYICL